VNKLDKLKAYAVLPLVPVAVVAFYGDLAVRAGYGIARAVVLGQTGNNRIFSESQRGRERRQ
jgi:alkylated DNA nucleotide flippase Atl1